MEYFIFHNNIAPCSIPQIINGMVENLPPRTKIQHGQPINVTCITNYDLAYQSNPIVCYNGSWSQSPTCVPGLFSILFFFIQLHCVKIEIIIFSSTM